MLNLEDLLKQYEHFYFLLRLIQLLHHIVVDQKIMISLLLILINFLHLNHLYDHKLLHYFLASILSLPKYGRKACGIITEPSACWKFSKMAAKVRPTAKPLPFKVWTYSNLPWAFL